MMRKRLAAVALSAAVSILALAPGQAAADFWIKCGDDNQTGAGWFDAKGHNVNCRTVRNVARGWHQNGGNAPPTWSCGFRSAGYEVGVVTCRRVRHGQVEVVRFKTGA